MQMILLLGLFTVSKLYFASYNYFFSDLQSLLGKKVSPSENFRGKWERELIATPSMGVWEKQALPITTILYHNFTDIVACAYASWA